MIDKAVIMLSLDSVPDSACQCAVCVGMCNRRPCWPTPEETKALLDAGFGPKLMLDWWNDEGEGAPAAQMIVPALVKHEGGHAPWWPIGRCTFLAEDDRCSLHDLGLKPAEGRKAIHGDSNSLNLHRLIAQLWAIVPTEEMDALKEQWRAKVQP